jgi:uncharacterized protein with HEPN domain
MRRDEAYLLDILVAARKALQFVEGINRREFEENELVQNAVMRPLEIIGEALPRFQRSFARPTLQSPGRKW